MKRDHFLFLIGGLAFGVLIGFGSYHAIHTTPVLDGGASQPGGMPMQSVESSAGGSGPSAGAPMVKRINQLKQTLQENPSDLPALLELGNLHYDVAMWPQAAGYYERAAALRPSPDVLTDLGVCLRGMKEFDRALATLARAHEMDPSHWQSLYNTVVVAAYDLQRFDLAEQAIDALEAIDPRPAGLAQLSLTELREAIRELASGAEKPS